MGIKNFTPENGKEAMNELAPETAAIDAVDYGADFSLDKESKLAYSSPPTLVVRGIEPRNDPPDPLDSQLRNTPGQNQLELAPSPQGETD